MTPLQFKVTNKAEYDDLLETIRKEIPDAIWKAGEKLDQWTPLDDIKDNWPVEITVYPDKKVVWCFNSDAEPDSRFWKIGQSLYEPTALESLISIPENPDGSITISPQLQAKLVIALRGGKE